MKGRQKQIQQTAGDGLSIRIDCSYEQPITMKLIRLSDFNDIKSIRTAFPELNTSLLRKDIPNIVLGFSTNFREVCKAMEEFSKLERQQQKETLASYKKQVPRILKEYHLSNIKLLEEQSSILRHQQQKIVPKKNEGRPRKRQVLSTSCDDNNNNNTSTSANTNTTSTNTNTNTGTDPIGVTANTNCT